jgi:AraC-binding-like domain
MQFVTFGSNMNKLDTYRKRFVSLQYSKWIRFQTTRELLDTGRRPAMNYQQWHTSQFDAENRSQSWARINDRFFGRLQVDCLHDQPLDASLEAYGAGSLHLFRIQATAHKVERNSSSGELPTDAFYKLLLQVRGYGQIEHISGKINLPPGDWVLYDPHMPYRIVNAENCDLLVAHIPKSLLGNIHVPQLYASKAQRNALFGLNHLLSSYLQSLHGLVRGLPDESGSMIGESILGLLGSTLAESNRQASYQVQTPALMRLRVRQIRAEPVIKPRLEYKKNC